MTRRDSSATSGQVGPKSPPQGGKSKFRQESAAAKPSDRLRREGEAPPPGEAPAPPEAPDEAAATSGQVGPKSGPKTKAEKQAAKEARRMGKSKFRVERTGEKLTAAKEKLAAQKPYKPPGVLKRLSQAAGHEVWHKAHGKLHEVERENVGTEAAHRSELLGERAGRAAARFVKRRNRTRPARRVRKWEHRNIKASADLHYRELAREHPELNDNAVKRFFQKRRVHKQYQKQAREAAKAAAKKTGGAAVSATEKAGRAAVAFVKRHPAGVMIALLCFLLLMVLQSCMGAAFTLGNSLGGAIGGTSYLAEDGEINSAELAYTEWETDLTIEAENAESTHGGYDEYRYDIDQTGHDPYAMLAYLTARYDDFTFAAVQGELQSIFAEQYTLTFTESVEVRYRTETVSDSWTDPVTGESYSDSYEIEVPYNWYVLTVTLTARPFEDVISPRLTTQDEQDRYEVYMFLHGNRQYVGSPFDFVWTPYVSSYYGYRVHPISGEKDYHTGADVALPEGTEILAGGDGVVVAAGTNGGYGLAVLVDYGEGITARYAHCSALLVGAGQTVAKGDVIARVGNTGTSTGPHLHMEVMKDGNFLNPLYHVDGTVG